MKRIDFKDFFPQVADTNMFRQPKAYESIKSMMVRVNEWILAEQIDVISVETLFAATRSAQNYQLIEEVESFGLAASQMGHHLQVIRVWYKE